MKTLGIFAITIFSVFLFKDNYAQNLKHSKIASQLKTEQKTSLKKAESIIEKADKKLSKADDIEEVYQKLSSSKKKRKLKRWEKKTWESKKNRISAEKDYQKAYQLAFDVYSEVINSDIYFVEEDEEKAKALNSEAEVALIESESEMSKYSKKKSKKTLKKVIYDKLKGDLDKSRKLKEEALSKQFLALDIVLMQEKKRIMDGKDNSAWYYAKNYATVEGYEEYISKFPDGKYVTQARDKIQKIQKNPKKDLETEDTEGNMGTTKTNFENTFKVQIAASKGVALSKNRLASIYSNVSEIEEVFIKGYYKYRIGAFSNYQEAAELKKTLKRGIKAFVVVIDKEGNQVEITHEMKKKN